MAEPVTLPPMPAGEWFACDEPERLTCTEPWEAAEQYIDNVLDPKMTPAEVEAAIRDLELTVTGYEPKAVTDLEIKHWSDALVESLEEKWCGEYGDPDGDSLHSSATATMLEAVTKIIRATRSWACQETGAVTLDENQAVEWARQERPDWFEEPAT